jgi:hypothetical protein
MPGGPGYGPPQPAPKKSKTGLIIGVVLGVLVLFGVLVVGAVMFVFSKATGTVHNSDVIASCDLRSGSSSGSGSELCMDLTVVNDKVRDICSRYKFSKKSCDRKGALGGCANATSITWTYPDSRHKTANDVKKECTDTFVTPSYQ